MRTRGIVPMTWTTHLSRSALPGLLLLLVGCSPKPPGDQEAGPAPVDTATELPRADSLPSADSSPTAEPVDSAVTPKPDTSVATPPITPATQPSDTPPSAGAKPSGPQGGGPKVSQLEYEGWRQYSVNCARCHGQDALPNPVAANLLVSLAPGGPMASPERFAQVVSEGRPDRGMPAFKGLMTPEQINATYAYVKGRAEKRIPPGRPASPGG
jgi:mono/diheme cytochrome c family protein